MLSDEDRKRILSLWKDEDFSASFSGVASLQRALKLEKNLTFSQRDIRKALQSDHNYLMNIQSKFRFAKRTYDNVVGYFKLAQADLAIMYKNEDNFQYCLVLIDVFSRRLFVRPLKTRDSASTKDALESIFREASQYPNILETDAGGNFIGRSIREYFKEKRILFKVKKNKCAVVERAIQTIKRRVFMTMRQKGDNDWVKYVTKVVENINNTPQKSAGNLKPGQIKSSLQDPEVLEAKRAAGIKIEQPDFIKWEENQKNYENSNAVLQKGTYVYLRFPRMARFKGHNLKSGPIYRISRVDARKSPELFYLVGLQGEKKDGSFYKEQLVPTKNVDSKNFIVEKVLKQRVKNGEKEFFVKYMWYPSRYNKWVKQKDLKPPDEKLYLKSSKSYIT